MSPELPSYVTDVVFVVVVAFLVLPGAGRSSTSGLVSAVSSAARRPSSASTPRRTTSKSQNEAIVELTKVLGIERVPNASKPHRAPMEYMVDLYSAVAYSDGISKTANPYAADVVRGIPDRGTDFRCCTHAVM